MTSSATRFANPKSTLLAAGLAVALAMAGPVGADRPSVPRLLPKTTIFYLSIPDVPDMTERFMNTSMGRMSQDPQLKPLLKEIYASASQLGDSLKDQTGLSLTEILAIPQGQLTVAVAVPHEAKPVFVAMLDTGDQLSRVEGLLNKLTEVVNRSGGNRTEQIAHDTTIVILKDRSPQGYVSYFEKDGTIVLASNLDVLKQILAVWNGEKGSSLADNRKFTSIMRRSGDPSQRPQLVWFADPIELLRLLGSFDPTKQFAVATLPALGLDGISAAGGALRMDFDEFGSVSHTHLLLDHPLDGVLKALAFTPGDTTPERWVPSDVASYTTVRLDLEKAYKTTEELFDSFRGDGALAASIDTRINQPFGIDLREDLLSVLSGRFTYVNWIERPVTAQSSASLIAFELKEDAEVDRLLEKLQAKFYSIIVEESYAGSNYTRISLPQWQERRAEGNPLEVAPPTPCFGVIDGSLIISFQEALYKKVVVTAQESTDKLADDADYKLMTAKMARQGGGATPVMVRFIRPEAALRFLYGLANADRTRKSLKSLNSSLESHPLPPFAVLEQYLAPSGSLILKDETGLHYVSFTLKAGGK